MDGSGSRLAVAWLGVGFGLLALASAPRVGLAQEAPATPSQPAASATSTSPVAEAQRLLSLQRPEEAWQLLAAREPELAGQPMFDYYLALAALDTGRKARAAGIYRRLLDNAPGFPGARLEYAQLLIELGREDEARRELARVVENPAESSMLRQRASSLLAQLAGRPASRLDFGGSVDAGAGYDSNANGSTSDTSFFGFTLDPRFRETPSGFVELGGALGVRAPVGGRGRFESQLRFAHRAHPEAERLDQTVTSHATTLLVRLGEFETSFGVNGYYGLLDGFSNQTALNLDLGVARRFAAERWEAAALLRVGRLDWHLVDQEILDVDRRLAGVALTRVGLGARGARLGGTLVVGRDEARREGSPFGNDRLGVRVFGALTVARRARLEGDVGYTVSRYPRGRFFDVEREDRQWAALVALQWADWPARDWAVAPQLRFTDNRSNLSVFAFDRWEAGLFVRRSFR